ncbi:ABC transporter ATP-binding protein [Taklimakanibacter deserti]|uniref:ABC transporter ATP-binding protein n=1 Tax=Taklimakanibacter deserti TaxID=2267839 RepID=UPI000E65DDB6
MAHVTIKGLHKHFGAVHVVKGIDLAIADGEFAVLVGPSGCGKSTLLRTIAGLETANEGTIEIGGKVVNDMRPRDRDVAMVFQDYALYPHMTVAENIGFGLRARNFPKPEIETRVKRAARMLNIEQFLERLPRQLSGGQRQRVAIGRAIVRNPQIFLFDEPLSNLDAQLRDEMRSEIKRLHQELGATMIYVTHDQIEAMTLADRIVLMNAGQIEQSGSPLELYERPRTRFVAGFLGSPKINFIRATLAESGVVFTDGQTLRLPQSAINRYKNHLGKAVVFGIRPQHIDRAGDGRTASITSRIDLVQPTGARTYVTFAIGQEPVMAELDAHDAGKPGDELKVAFDLDHFILIEPESGNVLGNGS